MTEAGRRYGDRYQITSAIASGGMAEVFLARDDLLDRHVALKVLHPEFARDRAFIERFRREARAAASLNDPRIVSVFDWGSDDGTYYIVMEYVDGRSLREVIETDGPLASRRALEIASDVCSALHFAHKQGIVHRDIKPANIAITPGAQTKVMDFGIARRSRDVAQTVTQTGTVIGTAAYLSPEQAQGLPVDARSDVYSVGVVLFEMLTGEVPFKGDSAVSVAYKHVRENPRPPSRLNREVTPDLDAVVMKALSKSPENRYQSAEEMRADFARILSGRPVEATPLLPDDETGVVRRRADATVVTSRPAGHDRTAVMAPAREPDRRRTLVYVLTFLLFFGLVIGAAALALSLLGGGGAKVEVPDVVGKSVNEARDTLDSMGFKVSVIDREPHESVPKDGVISQFPEGGIKADQGSTVDLIVSDGPEILEIPDLVGKTQAEAEGVLTQTGFKLGSVKQEASNTMEADRVISQAPGAREQRPRGSSVDLVVSSGPRPVRVPDVRGLPEDRAKQILFERGLNPVVKESCDRDKESGIVLSQNPEPGTQLAEQSDVEITVNRTILVPDVEGKDQEVAKSELEAAGFKVVVERRTAPAQKKGVVLDQDPSEGEAACTGDTVTITVAD